MKWNRRGIAGFIFFIVVVGALLGFGLLQASALSLLAAAVVVIALRIMLGQRRLPAGSWLIMWGSGAFSLYGLSVIGGIILAEPGPFPGLPGQGATAVWVGCLVATGLLIGGVFQASQANWIGPWVLDQPTLESVGIYGHCQDCRRRAPTRSVSFHQNIGMIIVRQYKSVQGYLCKDCVNKHFWDMTLTTLVGGWWGLISAILTPFILVNNVAQYLGTLTMGSAAHTAEQPQLTAAISQQLAPRRQEIVERLNAGEKVPVVAAEVGAEVGASPGQVVLYLAQAARLSALQQALEKQTRGNTGLPRRNIKR